VGVLFSLYDNLQKEDIAYDAVVGVSIGAVNSGTIGIFEKGKEKESFSLLKEYWSDLNTDDLFV
jgi:predicted acylesterase/phospholipase RssA